MCIWTVGCHSARYRHMTDPAVQCSLSSRAETVCTGLVDWAGAVQTPGTSGIFSGILRIRMPREHTREHGVPAARWKPQTRVGIKVLGWHSGRPTASSQNREMPADLFHSCCPAYLSAPRPAAGQPASPSARSPGREKMTRNYHICAKCVG
jgi:hypothetical protein